MVNNEFMRGVPWVEMFNPSILDVVIVIKTDGRIMPIFRGIVSVSFLYNIVCFKNFLLFLGNAGTRLAETNRTKKFIV